MRISYSTRWLLLAVAYVAVTSTAIKQGSWVVADLLWALMWFAWIYAVLAALYQKGDARAGALGFAMALGSFATLATLLPSTVPTPRLIAAFDSEYQAQTLSFQPSPRRTRATLADRVSAAGARMRTVNIIFATVAGVTGYWLGLLAYRRAHGEPLPAERRTDGDEREEIRREGNDLEN